MEQLKTVAGAQMQQLLEDVNTEIYFVTLCAMQVSPELGGQVRGVRCLPREWETKLSSALLEIVFDWGNSREVRLGPQAHRALACWAITRLGTRGCSGVWAQSTDAEFIPQALLPGCC